MSKKKQKKSQKQTKWDALWADAKRKCRLNVETIRMAKELGMHPRSLLKNIPSKSQPWKAPIHVWIRDLYERRQERAGRRQNLEAETEASKPSVQSDSIAPDIEIEDLMGPDWDDDEPPDPEEIAEENAGMLARQGEFRLAAMEVSDALASLPGVLRVVLFGSVAGPLETETPRFRKFRRAGIEILHECGDVDLAVWVDNLSDLRQLQRARSSALKDLFDRTGVGVAHHQVDIFLFQPGTDRYLGRLCTLGECPKDKRECDVPDCGNPHFLKQHEDFALRPDALDPQRIEVLHDRDQTPTREIGPDEIPF